jgi:putative ABC transport system permease protein
MAGLNRIKEEDLRWWGEDEAKNPAAVDLGLKMLFHDRLRFGLTTFGVAFSVMLVLVQVGLFEGLIGYAADTILPIRSADLWITSKNTQNIDFANYFPQELVNRVRSVPGVGRADNMMVDFMPIHLPNGSSDGVMVYGLSHYWKWGVPWNVVSGHPLDLRRGPYLFLDDFASHRYGPFRIGEYREIVNRRFRIIGVVHGIRSFTTIPVAFLDFSQAQALTDTTFGKTAYILVKLAPGADRDSVVSAIRRRLPYNDVFTRKAWARRSQDYWIFKTGLGFNMGMIVFLGCLVGVVILAQTLYTTTMEHIREFGMVKAIGGSNADIYRILTRQALVIAVAGFLVGTGLAFALKPLVHRADLDLILSPSLLGVVFVFTVALCLLSSMVSFRKVSSIDPALLFRG